MTAVLDPDLLHRMDAYWRAANYLSVGQIYLYDNPLLKRAAGAVACQAAGGRALGHHAGAELHLRAPEPGHQEATTWTCSTSPGPATAGPALVGNTYLEGTYSEVYPDISQDEAGLKRLFTQFSFPGGISSHVAPTTPGSIHEGGELGYSLSHAFGAAFDNPDLIVACVDRRRRGRNRAAGDRLAVQQVPQPGHRRRGAADPAPQRLQDQQPHGAGPHRARGAGAVPARLRLDAVLRRRRRARRRCTSSWPRALDEVIEAIRAHPERARSSGDTDPAALADDRAAVAQGLDRPEGRRRAADRGHVPRAPGAAAGGRRAPRPPRRSSRAGCGATGREELFDEHGRLLPELAELAPGGDRRMGANPHANGGAAAARPADAGLPRPRRGRAVARRGRRPGHAGAGHVPARCGHAQRTTSATSGSSAPTRRSRTCWARSSRSPTASGTPARVDNDEFLAPAGRVLDSMLSEHQCEGWLEGYLLTGRHGLFNCYEAFIHIVDSMFNQHAKWLKVTARAAVAADDRLAELPARLARLAAGPQRLHPPGPGLPRPRGQQEGRHRAGLPAAGRQLPAVGGRPLPAQPPLRQRRRRRQARRCRSG